MSFHDLLIEIQKIKFEREEDKRLLDSQRVQIDNLVLRVSLLEQFPTQPRESTAKQSLKKQAPWKGVNNVTNSFAAADDLITESIRSVRRVPKVLTQRKVKDADIIMHSNNEELSIHNHIQYGVREVKVSKRNSMNLQLDQRDYRSFQPSLNDAIHSMNQMRTIGSLSQKRLPPPTAQVSMQEPMLMHRQIAPKPLKKDQKVLVTERKHINPKREIKLRIETVKADTNLTKEKDWDNTNLMSPGTAVLNI